MNAFLSRWQQRALERRWAEIRRHEREAKARALFWALTVFTVPALLVLAYFLNLQVSP